MRSSVDLPQPDGPTSTTNSPSLMSNRNAVQKGVVPKDFRTPAQVTLAKGGLPKSCFFSMATMHIAMHKAMKVRRLGNRHMPYR